jgi:hypothetical protein
MLPGAACEGADAAGAAFCGGVVGVAAEAAVVCVGVKPCSEEGSGFIGSEVGVNPGTVAWPAGTCDAVAGAGAGSETIGDGVAFVGMLPGNSPPTFAPPTVTRAESLRAAPDDDGVFDADFGAFDFAGATTA